MENLKFTIVALLLGRVTMGRRRAIKWTWWPLAATCVRAEAEVPDVRPTILVIRSLAPWQEPLYPALVANDRWFCATASLFRCLHRTWRTLPPGREEFHPWFSRFHLGSHALADSSMPADVVLWLDVDAFFFRHAAEVEAELLTWLPFELARAPLLLALASEGESTTHMPKAYFVSNSSSAREVLDALSAFLPREDRPLVPNGRRGHTATLLHAYAYDGDTRAREFGTAGQLELLDAAWPALSSLIHTLPAGRVVARELAAAAQECGAPGAFATSALAGLRAAAANGEPDAARPWFRAFIGHASCAFETIDEVLALADVVTALNVQLGAPPPPAVDARLGGSVAAQARALAVGEAYAAAAVDDRPVLLLIVYGAQYARERTPVFVRSLLAARSGPLRLYVLGDPPGLAEFRRVLRDHGGASGLLRAEDEVSLFSADASRYASLLPTQTDPSCRLRDYGYLFYKLFAHELLPAQNHVLVLDSDALVLGDVYALWAEFARFEAGQLIGMSRDMSHRYYYRLSDPSDELFSEGWRDTPGRTGVNGGMMVLHLERMRAVGFTQRVVEATHVGARLRDAGQLSGFCVLAEQDTINLMAAREPALLRFVDCAWNYMGTRVGGHELEGEGPELLLYDSCPNGPRAADGGEGDMLSCECGRKIEVLHFAGRTRRKLEAINASIWAMSGEELVAQALERRRAPAYLPAGRGSRLAHDEL
jgi:hypothetical protein